MTAISFQSVSKAYPSPKSSKGSASGSNFLALDAVSLDIEEGEFFGLLGPNGAGKTTMISVLAGLTRATSGKVSVLGHDVQSDFAKARRALGVVPQELVFDPFFNVRELLRIQSGYFGIKNNGAWIDELLESLGLSDKANANMRQLSGGMKRRVLIAKALSHEPTILFLDEPTAGVDVELRRDMWEMVRRLRDQGVTIILTTHYIEEAEEMADRIGVIDGGKIILIGEKHALMEKLGRTRVTIGLCERLEALPESLADERLVLAEDGLSLVLTLTGEADGATGAADLVKQLVAQGIGFRSIDTARTSLEDIFVDLVEKRP